MQRINLDGDVVGALPASFASEYCSITHVPTQDATFKDAGTRVPVLGSTNKAQWPFNKEGGPEWNVTTDGVGPSATLYFDRATDVSVLFGVTTTATSNETWQKADTGFCFTFTNPLRCP